jgi:two-component sensor histidine kinase
MLLMSKAPAGRPVLARADGTPVRILAVDDERDTARSPTAGSTSLGLAIVRAVVIAHGGRVSLETRPGSTTFLIWLSCTPTGRHRYAPPGVGLCRSPANESVK